MTRKGEIKRRWPKDKEARLRELWHEPMTLSAIAAELSSPGFEVSRGTVFNKGNAMKLGARPTGIAPTPRRPRQAKTPTSVAALPPGTIKRKNFAPPPGAQYPKYTRRESEDMLRQAILNTGGKLVAKEGR